MPEERRDEARFENNLGLTKDESTNFNAGGGQDSEIVKSFVFLTLCLGTARSEVGSSRLNIITAGMRKLFTEGPPQKSGMNKHNKIPQENISGHWVGISLVSYLICTGIFFL